MHKPNYKFYLADELPDHEIFVFGSNTAGRHGAGAAKTAYLHYGAKYGVAEGLCNQSYAIPTREWLGPRNLKTLELSLVVANIQRFVQFTQTSYKHFYVTAVGCGFAGFRVSDIAPHFSGAMNCRFPIEFKPYLEK